MKRFSVVAVTVSLLLCSAFAGPVSHFGALKRCGSNICGEKTGDNTPIFVKGPSLFWSSGYGSSFYDARTVDWFVDNFQIGIIRAAMGIQYYKENSEPLNAAGTTFGYYYNKDGQKKLIKAVVDAAIANDIYVIVDWHSHNAQSETDLAKTFFGEMAKEYKDVPNIIWEVYNEPVGADAGTISNYANTVISAIRSAGNKNLAIIGSRFYSQNPKEQAQNWGSKDNNVAFTFHFYAGSHQASGDIGNSAKDAIKAGYPVFASEWGSVDANGGGSVNSGAADSWTSWMDSEKISNCMWNASNIDEGSSIFNTSTNVSNLSTNGLTNSGKYFQTYMGKNKWTALIPSNHPKGNDVNTSVDDGKSIKLDTQLGITGTISKVSEPEFGKATIASDGKSITYETPSTGSPSDKVRLIYEITQNNVTVQSKIVINITNRRPVLPEKAPIAVSRRAPTEINIVSTLSVQDPSGKGIEFGEVTVEPSSVGTISISSNKQIATFTPASSQHDVESTEATLNYTVKGKEGGSNSSKVTLKIQNFAPTIRAIGSNYAPTFPNTDPVGIGMKMFSGADKDGDPIEFDQYYLDPKYPGELKRVEGRKDSLVYIPESGKIGKVTILATITDGTAKSPTGGVTITLTGSGSEINVTPPTSIPGVVDPDPGDPDDPEPPVLAHPNINAKGMGLSPLGLGRVQLNFASSGFAKLDVYSLSGKKMGNLLSGYQNAGSQEVSLNGLNLQKGVYILRLSQGSQVKTLRVVN